MEVTAPQAIRIDPLMASLLPPLTEEEEAALRQGIAAEGVLVPIEVDQHGTITDGHNRYRIWEELRAEGLDIPHPPAFVRYVGSDEERLERGLRLNLQRRHIDRAALKTIAIDRRAAGWTTRRIADVLGISAMTVVRWAPEPVVTPDTPEPNGATEGARVTGKDGKSYPARKRSKAVIAQEAREVAVAGPALERIEEQGGAGLFRDPILTPGEARVEAMAEARHRLLGATERVVESPGSRWHRDLHDIWVRINTARDAGGFAVLVRRWSPDDRRMVAEELRRIASTFTDWVATLEESGDGNR